MLLAALGGGPGRLRPGARAQRGPGATRALVGLMLAASAAEAVAGARRGGAAAAPSAAAGALGFAAELAGVRDRPAVRRTTRYSGKLGPRVGGVPLLAAAAWAMMARPAWVVGRAAVAPPRRAGRRSPRAR